MERMPQDVRACWHRSLGPRAGAQVRDAGRAYVSGGSTMGRGLLVTQESLECALGTAACPAFHGGKLCRHSTGADRWAGPRKNWQAAIPNSEGIGGAAAGVQRASDT